MKVALVLDDDTIDYERPSVSEVEAFKLFPLVDWGVKEFDAMILNTDPGITISVGADYSAGNFGEWALINLEALAFEGMEDSDDGEVVPSALEAIAKRLRERWKAK